MTWEGDNIFPRAGVYELFDNGTSLGILATWYEPVSGMKYVNEWRVHLMPLSSNVRVVRTADYHTGAVNDDTLADRRATFQQVWNAYVAQHSEILQHPKWDPANPNTAGLVDQEWIGTVQDGQGFNLISAGSATAYGGPPPANRNP